MTALSMYGDVHYQERMVEAGASAYVLKNEAIDDLVKAIQAALRGDRFVSPAVVQYDSMAAQRSVNLDKHALSEREAEVLRRLAEGQRIKEMADALGISAKTVETYRSRIMLKLGIDNLPGLVKFAIRAGIASLQI